MRQPAPILLALTASALLAPLPACRTGDKAPAAAAYPVRIETAADGVKTILNPAFPKEGVLRYALQADLVLGGEGGGTEGVFNRPLFLDLDAQGNIYVLDWGDYDFKVFAPDGRLLRRFGKQGQGPGDFDIPAYFTLAADGRIFLLSGRQNQIIILRSDGTYLSSFRIDGFCDGIGVDGRDRVYYSRFLTPDAGSMGEEFELVQNRMALYRTDEKGAASVRLGEFPDVTMLRKAQKIGGAMTSNSMTSRESYTTSWLVGPGDRVYLGYNKDYLLTVYDADWKPVFRFGREFTPLRHPQYKAGGAHPEFYPAFSDWRKFFDDQGNLWLEQYVEEGAKDHAFDVFSPEGVYLRQVRVPETLFLVRGGKGYSIVRTEDEFLMVKRFLMIPEAGPAKGPR